MRLASLSGATRRVGATADAGGLVAAGAVEPVLRRRYGTAEDAAE